MRDLIVSARGMKKLRGRKNVSGQISLKTFMTIKRILCYEDKQLGEGYANSTETTFCYSKCYSSIQELTF